MFLGRTIFPVHPVYAVRPAIGRYFAGTVVNIGVPVSEIEKTARQPMKIVANRGVVVEDTSA